MGLNPYLVKYARERIKAAADADGSPTTRAKYADMIRRSDEVRARRGEKAFAGLTPAEPAARPPLSAQDLVDRSLKADQELAMRRGTGGVSAAAVPSSASVATPAAKPVSAAPVPAPVAKSIPAAPIVHPVPPGAVAASVAERAAAPAVKAEAAAAPGIISRGLGAIRRNPGKAGLITAGLAGAAGLGYGAYKALGGGQSQPATPTTTPATPSASLPYHERLGQGMEQVMRLQMMQAATDAMNRFGGGGGGPLSKISSIIGGPAPSLAGTLPQPGSTIGQRGSALLAAPRQAHPYIAAGPTAGERARRLIAAPYRALQSISAGGRDFTEFDKTSGLNPELVKMARHRIKMAQPMMPPGPPVPPRPMVQQVPNPYGPPAQGLPGQPPPAPGQPPPPMPTTNLPGQPMKGAPPPQMPAKK